MEDRRKIILVQRYLYEHGFTESFFAFQNESQIFHDFEEEEGGNHERIDHIIDEYDQVVASRANIQSQERRSDEEELLKRSEEPNSFTLNKKIEDIHVLNPLCIRFSPFDQNIMATGGADKLIQIRNLENNQILSSFSPHTGGVLSIDFHPLKSNLLLSSSMDGTVAIVDTSCLDQDCAAIWKEHKKFVVRSKWSPNGKYFASCSYDKSVSVYKLEENDIQNSGRLIRREFIGAVETIAFSPDSTYLVIGCREDNYLHYINLSDFSTTRHNLNSNGDNFVSFTPMDVLYSPNGKYVSVLTDKNRLIVMRANTGIQLLNVYDLYTDPLGQPRHCWDPSGKYFYVSCGNDIQVVEIATQRVIDRLKGHTSIVRDLTFHPSSNIFASVAFDKSALFWAKSQ